MAVHSSPPLCHRGSTAASGWSKSRKSHNRKQNVWLLLLLPLLQDGNGLWYTQRWSEQQWLDAWSIVAKRYANNSAVVGVGLRNEPRPTLAGQHAAAAPTASQALSLLPYNHKCVCVCVLEWLDFAPHSS